MMQEKNIDILKRAIEDLPVFSCSGSKEWTGIRQQLDSEDKYQKLKAQMPSFEAPELAWDRLESQLEKQDPALTEVINELPRFNAPENSWEELSKKLDKDSKVHGGKVRYLVLKYAAAASIVFAVSLAILIPRINPDHKIPRSFEQSHGAFEHGGSAGIESLYNPALCKSNPQVCQTELFKTLDRQRNEIENEIETMEPMIQKENPQMMKYYHRLVNEQMEIEKRMVRMIMES